MAASALNGENHIMPIAIATANVENEANWTYLLNHLLSGIPVLNTSTITVMNDYEKSLENGQSQVIPIAQSACCVFHIEKNVNNLFKTKVDGKIWRAAKSTTVSTFNQTMVKISVLNSKVLDYINQILKSKWVAAYAKAP